MDIRKYIAETERTYHYRIKTVVPLDDKALDKIERAILKYQPLDMSAPKKTIFQSQPLDFPTIMNAEVYIVDVNLGLPASSYVLQQELRLALDVPEKFVVVRGEGDPTEVETQRIDAEHNMDLDAQKKGLKPSSLLDNEKYEEIDGPKGEDLYGTTYNSRFLNYLAKVEKDRASKVVDPKTPLFTWMAPHEKAEDYNANVKDAPKLGDAGGDSEIKVNVNPKGNLNDDGRTYGRSYRTKDGKLEVLRVKPDALRKGGK